MVASRRLTASSPSPHSSQSSKRLPLTLEPGQSHPAGRRPLALVCGAYLAASRPLNSLCLPESWCVEPLLPSERSQVEQRPTTTSFAATGRPCTPPKLPNGHRKISTFITFPRRLTQPAARSHSPHGEQVNLEFSPVARLPRHGHPSRSSSCFC
jgi:hypothetical protein